MKTEHLKDNEMKKDDEYSTTLAITIYKVGKDGRRNVFFTPSCDMTVDHMTAFLVTAINSLHLKNMRDSGEES